MAWLAIPAIVVASIWLPVIRYYHAPDPWIGPEVIERARREPPQSRLEELRGERLLLPWPGAREVINAAENLLRGELHLGGQPVVQFRPVFRADNLAVGTRVMQLYVAGLVPADLLLQAYELTGEERFFSAARELIVEFARYERKAWFPRGLLWDDHAVANRVFVLSDFWRVYRQRPDFEAQKARAILTLVGRSGELLADPQQFAFAGNHGVMQNIGLLRLRLGFPTLPKSDYYQRLAMERLEEQLAYYVSEDGVVLEHSAGYQFFGIELLRLVFHYARLLDIAVPIAWERKLARAEQFAAQLPRPDGTLPMYGDTGRSAQRPRFLRGRPGSLPGRPGESVTWDPMAGYAIWWDGLEYWPEARRARQTLVTFSYFPGHLHKHADELSVLLWAGGQTWWTDVGGWPPDRQERRLAESWNGSSAPHLLDEPTRSDRVPRGLFHGSSERTVILEVAREGPAAYRVRRQVVHVKPNNWLVIGAVSGAPGRVSATRWTTGRGVIVRDGESRGSYVLETQSGPARLFVSYFGSPGMRLRTLPNTLGPFPGYGPDAGEIMVGGIEVTQSGDDSWAATAWLFDEDGTMLPRLQARMTLWRGPEEWSALLPGGRTPLEISRQGDRVTVNVGRGLRETVALERVEAAPQRQEIIQAFQRTAKKYPRFPLRIRYRQWTTYALIGAMGAQELFLLAIVRWARRFYGRLRLLTLPLWVVGGILLAVLLGW